MKKLATLLCIFTFLFVINITLIITTYAHERKNTKIAIILDEISAAAPGGSNNTTQVLGIFDDNGNVIKKDERVAILKAFLRTNDSPLYDHAETIVSIADKYGIDFRLVPAISMQESTGCKVIPPGSHNCWGWRIYGGKITRFDSYDEAIETVSKGLKANYIDHGLKTPTEIMAKYNPSSPNGSWAHGVDTFFGRLEL